MFLWGKRLFFLNDYYPISCWFLQLTDNVSIEILCFNWDIMFQTRYCVSNKIICGESKKTFSLFGMILHDANVRFGTLLFIMVKNDTEYSVLWKRYVPYFCTSNLNFLHPTWIKICQSTHVVKKILRRFPIGKTCFGNKENPLTDDTKFPFFLLWMILWTL